MVEDNKQIQNPKDDDISFSTNEIDDIINSAEITEEVKNDDALDEYGVWIKIPPEDYKETGKPALNSPELASAEKINQDLTEEEFLSNSDVSSSDLQSSKSEDQGKQNPDNKKNFNTPSEQVRSTALIEDVQSENTNESVIDNLEKQIHLLKEEMSLVKLDLSKLKEPTLDKQLTHGSKMSSTGFFDQTDEESITLTTDEIENILGDDVNINETSITEDQKNNIKKRDLYQKKLPLAESKSNYPPQQPKDDLSDEKPANNENQDELKSTLSKEPVVESIDLEIPETNSLPIWKSDPITLEKSVKEQDKPINEIVTNISTKQAIVNDQSQVESSDTPAENRILISNETQNDIRLVLKYLDQLLDSLPEEKIEKFAGSEEFEKYKKLFEEFDIDE